MNKVNQKDPLKEIIQDFLDFTSKYQVPFKTLEKTVQSTLNKIRHLEFDLNARIKVKKERGHWKYGDADADYGAIFDRDEFIVTEPAEYRPDWPLRNYTRVKLKELSPQLNDLSSNLQKSYDSCWWFQFLKKMKIKRYLGKIDHYSKKHHLE